MEHACTIENRSARNRFADHIVGLMTAMFPDQRRQPDFDQKMWDHLIIMSGYKLDVDSPYPIPTPEDQKRPERIPYPKNRLHFRHYGNIVERIVERAAQTPIDRVRKQFLNLAANVMKNDLLQWNSVHADDDRIFADINTLSAGQLHIDRNSGVTTGAYKSGAKPQNFVETKKKRKKKKNKNKKNYQY